MTNFPLNYSHYSSKLGTPHEHQHSAYLSTAIENSGVLSVKAQVSNNDLFTPLLTGSTGSI